MSWLKMARELPGCNPFYEVADAVIKADVILSYNVSIVVGTPGLYKLCGRR